MHPFLGGSLPPGLLPGGGGPAASAMIDVVSLSISASSANNEKIVSIARSIVLCCLGCILHAYALHALCCADACTYFS